MKLNHQEWMNPIAIVATLIFASLIFAAPAVYAQSVTLGPAGYMRFSDQLNRVTFLYPASWTFSLDQPFYLPLSTTGQSEAAPRGTLRGFVFSKSMLGVATWPGTAFVGLEVGYDTRELASENDCRAFAMTEDNHDGKTAQVTLHDLTFWHATAGSAGLGHGIGEDVYTTYTGSGANGLCLRFDLAIQYVNLDGEQRLHPITPSQTAHMHAVLLKVLNSVRMVNPHP
jgi:hypothetical protein